MIDANRNDSHEDDEVQSLKTFRGEGEHGYHAVVAGLDGMVYVLNGNATRLPAGLVEGSPYRHYSGDMLPLRPELSGACGLRRDNSIR